MNRTPLLAIIVGIAVLIALLDFWTSAELVGSVLFTFPLALCIDTTVQVAALGHSGHSYSVERCCRDLEFPSDPAPEPLDRFGKPRTSRREPSYAYDTHPSVDQQEPQGCA